MACHVFKRGAKVHGMCRLPGLREVLLSTAYSVEYFNGGGEIDGLFRKHHLREVRRLMANFGSLFQHSCLAFRSRRLFFFLSKLP